MALALIVPKSISPEPAAYFYFSNRASNSAFSFDELIKKEVSTTHYLPKDPGGSENHKPVLFL